MQKTVLVLVFLLLAYSSGAQAVKPLDKPRLAAIPLISYNKSFGGIFGALASLYFPIGETPHASTVGGGAFATTNGTWFAFGFTRLYYAKDNLRTTVAGGVGDINFQYYAESYSAPGAFVQFTTTSDFFFAEQLVRVHGRLYTGIDFIFFKAKTAFETDTFNPAARNYVALGIPITYDSRDNVQNPGSGWYANARLNRFDSVFGSANEFTKLDLDASTYIGRDRGHLLAARASLSTGLGDVPFEGQTVVGGNVLRGYSNGKYRGDQVYSLQAEYRWNFYKRWGAVFFGGVATPVNDDVEWTTDYILPAVGTGLRFMMIPNIGLNVGFDAAAGKDDYGIYFRIGEAF